jgi:hypothetical protein
MTSVTPVLKSIRQEITDSGKNIDETLEKGREIYARKPAIKNEDVTWSQEEYADLGLIFEYCRYKSIQRLTEAWSTFEKAKKKRLFEFVDRKIQQMDERRQKPRETNEYDADAAVEAAKEEEEDVENVFLRVASLGFSNELRREETRRRGVDQLGHRRKLGKNLQPVTTDEVFRV